MGELWQELFGLGYEQGADDNVTIPFRPGYSPQTLVDRLGVDPNNFNFSVGNGRSGSYGHSFWMKPSPEAITRVNDENARREARADDIYQQKKDAFDEIVAEQEIEKDALRANMFDELKSSPGWGKFAPEDSGSIALSGKPLFDGERPDVPYLKLPEDKVGYGTMSRSDHRNAHADARRPTVEPGVFPFATMDANGRIQYGEVNLSDPSKTGAIFEAIQRDILNEGKLNKQVYNGIRATLASDINFMFNSNRPRPNSTDFPVRVNKRGYGQQVPTNENMSLLTAAKYELAKILEDPAVSSMLTWPVNIRDGGSQVTGESLLKVNRDSENPNRVSIGGSMDHLATIGDIYNEEGEVIHENVYLEPRPQVGDKILALADKVAEELVSNNWNTWWPNISRRYTSNGNTQDDVRTALTLQIKTFVLASILSGKIVSWKSLKPNRNH
jgi:hypothetical protein